MAAMVDPCILHPFRAPVLQVRCAGAPGTAEPPQRTLSDFTAYFTTFLRKKIHPPRGFSTSSKMFVEKRIENGFRCALAIVSGRIIFNFAFVALCGALQTLFSREGSQRQTAIPTPLSAKARRGGKVLPVCALIRRCAPPSPDRGKALAAVAKSPVKPQSLRACPLPLGGAGAQRLRGYGWRSEKSVKAIAPTGAALAFLCFDFFFRIVKGV